eukprot:366573-Chlamydomonas_euryale.AAC.1
MHLTIEALAAWCKGQSIPDGPRDNGAFYDSSKRACTKENPGTTKSTHHREWTGTRASERHTRIHGSAAIQVHLGVDEKCHALCTGRRPAGPTRVPAKPENACMPFCSAE